MLVQLIRNDYVEAIDSVGNAEQKQPKSELSIKLVQTGIEDVDEENANSSAPKVSISPNPFHDRIDLKINEVNSGVLIIRIVNMAGRIVYTIEKKHHGGSATYQLTGLNLNAGIYNLIHTGKEKELGSVKVVKQ